MASNFYGAIGISGGSDGFLDNIDGTNLADGDGVVVIQTVSNLAGFYELDVDSAVAQVVPTVMQPDDNAGDKRWLLRAMSLSGISLYEPATTNLVTFAQSSGNLTIDNTYDTGTITFKGENSGDATMLVMDPAGSVELYEAGSKKFETSATGVTITGVSASTTSTSGTYDATTDFTVGDLVITDGVITDATGLQIAAATTVVGTITSDGLILGDNEDIAFGAVALMSSDGSKLIAQNGAGTETLFTALQNGAVTLYYDNGAKFATSNTGATLTGTLVADGLTMSDNESITLGAGPDGIIKSDGTGIAIMNAAGDEYMFYAVQNDATALYYNGNAKFETTNTGATVTGTLVAEGLTLGDNEEIRFGAGPDAVLASNGTRLAINNGAWNEVMAAFNQNGSVDLYYNNNKKFETSNTGATITGTLVADGLTFGDETMSTYDEGTWTPTAADAASGGNTGTTGTGNYIQVGSLMTVWGTISNIDTTGLTAGNDFYIQGLPVAASGRAQGTLNADTITFTSGAGNGYIVCEVNATSAIRLVEIRTGAGESLVDVNQLTSGTTDVWFTLTYEI